MQISLRLILTRDEELRKAQATLYDTHRMRDTGHTLLTFGEAGRRWNKLPVESRVLGEGLHILLQWSHVCNWWSDWNFSSLEAPTAYFNLLMPSETGHCSIQNRWQANDWWTGQWLNCKLKIQKGKKRRVVVKRRKKKTTTLPCSLKYFLLVVLFLWRLLFSRQHLCMW